MQKVNIPAQTLPVLSQVDVCVLGGSCTGVFAAVKAAKLGAKTVLIERQNRAGGTASLSQVCYWHSFFSMDGTKQVIAGLSQEVIDRLAKRNAVTLYDKFNPSFYAKLNTEELCIDLDEMLLSAGVEVFYHTSFAAPYTVDGELKGVIVCGKGGMQVILAKQFVDATGDGDLAASLHYPMWRNDHLQPPTMCAKYSKIPGAPAENFIWELGKLVHAKREKYHMPEGNIWGCALPDSTLYMIAGTKIPKLDVADLRNLSAAEIEGRRQIRATMDIIAESGYPRPVLEALPSLIGIRDTRHIKGLYQLTTEDLLWGKPFDDAIAYGTYRLDIHQQDPPGVLFQYLDGKQEFHCPHKGITTTDWRDRSLPTPDCYQIPLRCLIPQGSRNVICAGRMLDADKGAFGATRVMVTMNQTGEAAGVAAYLALNGNCDITQVPAKSVRKHLHQW